MGSADLKNSKCRDRSSVALGLLMKRENFHKIGDCRIFEELEAIISRHLG